MHFTFDASNRSADVEVFIANCKSKSKGKGKGEVTTRHLNGGKQKQAINKTSQAAGRKKK